MIGRQTLQSAPSACAVREGGQVTRGLASLLDAVGFAEKQASELEARLAGILGTVNSPPADPNTAKLQEPMVPVADAVLDITRRVNAIGYALQSLRDRVEL